MDTAVNIAIIEKFPLAGLVLESVLIKADFHVVANVKSAYHFLRAASENAIRVPDACLLDSAVKETTIENIKKYYPRIKIIIYDPISSNTKGNPLPHSKCDAYIARSVKVEQWIAIIKGAISSTYQ